MSYQQSKQKCKLPAKCLPKCPPKCPPQAPQVPASCPAPCPHPAPSCCAPSYCISGFGGNCCLISYRFPRFYLRQPQHSGESESSGCSSCCHDSGDCC
ncbi:late cornified envelope protein 7A [Loxodonta africana]|uniref:late cornified envelope protein 7A n=1 Tax=Elephas maximus indicus TaxID=99487 RepID=UPI002116C5D8|nr:late cornified envelope protein 7A [Elephas maximus indicus]